MSSLNRFFLCNCVFICASKIYGDSIVNVNKINEKIKINADYYYLDFVFGDKSKLAGVNDYYYV